MCSLLLPFLRRAAVSWHDRNRYRTKFDATHSNHTHTPNYLLWRGSNRVHVWKITVAVQKDGVKENFGRRQPSLIPPPNPLSPSLPPLVPPPVAICCLEIRWLISPYWVPLPPAPTQSPLGAVTLSTLETPPFAVPLVRTQLCLICLSQKKEEVELWLTRAGGEQSLFACGDWGGEYETHSSLLLRKLSTWLRSCMSHCLCSLHLIFFLCCPPPPPFVLALLAPPSAPLEIWIPDVWRHTPFFTRP